MAEGFSALIAAGGRSFSADTGEGVRCLVDDAPDVGDPVDIPKAKQPVYARLHAKAGSVASPYAVKTFTESGTNKIYTVLRYEVDLMGTEQRWMCERQR